MPSTTSLSLAPSSPRVSRQEDKPVLLCFPYRRWTDEDPRLRELMSRAAADYRVVVFEEPVLDGQGAGELTHRRDGDVEILQPHLPPRLADRTANAALRKLLDDYQAGTSPAEILWLISPAAMAFSSHVTPKLRIYDCVEDLASRPNAPATLPLLERRVLGRVDVVITATKPLFELQRFRHKAVKLIALSSATPEGWDGLWSAMRSEIRSRVPQAAGPADVSRSSAAGG
ncbi:glycosyltransferase family protein [Alsobacter sp. SYSU BS001988]